MLYHHLISIIINIIILCMLLRNIVLYYTTLYKLYKIVCYAIMLRDITYVCKIISNVYRIVYNVMDYHKILCIIIHTHIILYNAI